MNRNRFNIFCSRYNHNGSYFRMVHFIPVFLSNYIPSKIKYEFNGTNMDEIVGENNFLNFNQNSPFVLSFVVEKGQTYFIKALIEYTNKKTECISKFYNIPDDYENLNNINNALIIDDKVSIDITKADEEDNEKINNEFSNKSVTATEEESENEESENEESENEKSENEESENEDENEENSKEIERLILMNKISEMNIMEK